MLYPIPFVPVTDCTSTRECSMTLNKTGTGCLVDCTHWSSWDTLLRHIPTDLPKSTANLTLVGNQITTVNSTPFVHLENLQYLNIVSNNVSKVSRVNITSLQDLILRHNAISSIDKGMFTGLINLRSLHLERNQISRIESGSFDGLLSLKVLNLMKNHLSFTNFDSVPKALFSKLVNLQLLFLHDNLNPDFRGDLVENLTQLQELHLDGPRNRSVNFPRQFLRLTELSKLVVYGEMEYVTNSTLAYLSNCPVQTLGLASTQLIDFEPDSLKPLKNLRILSLSANEKLSLCNVTHLWHGLNWSPNLAELYFNQVMDLFSNEALVPCDFFRGLKKEIIENIETLDLGYNNLVQIDKQFIHLKSLKIFSLDFNRIQRIKRIVCWPHDSVAEITPPLPCYPGCAKNSSYPGNFTTDNGILHLPGSIRHLRMNAAMNYILNSMPKLSIEGCTSLEILEMHDNSIGNFIGPIMFTGISAKRKIISLKGNFATEMSPDFIIDTRVKDLLLGGNRLGNKLWEDTEGNTFSKFVHLEVLDLSENMIKTLPENVFSNLVNLKELNISHNAIATINFKIEDMPHLQVLDLTRNSFVTLPENVAERMDAHGNLSINLEGNPLVCSCEYLFFLKWLKDSNGKTKKPRYRKFQCHYGTAGYVHLGWFFDNEFDIFYKGCYSYLYLTVSCVCFAVMAISLTTATITYKFRWDIKFLITTLIYKEEWKQLFDSVNDYEYDAFIAYHVGNLHWVRTQLLHRFENACNNSSSSGSDGNRSLRLCVHDRNFLPGKTPEENITESIQRSRKTVIIMSKRFAASGWCHFELQMARLNCFDKKMNNIVVVVLEPVPLRLISRSLNMLLRRTTFIEWPRSPANHALFWEKLRKAITGPGNPVVCECGYAMRNMWESANSENPSNGRPSQGGLSNESSM